MTFQAVKLNRIEFHQQGLYFVLLVLSSALFLLALGPGLFQLETVSGQSWQHRIFHILCHQDPLRSYSFNGQVMAVCSRCIGIYLGFALCVSLMPVLSRFFTVINSQVLKLIVVAIVINFLDVLGNSVDIWTNTLLSRFLLGSLIGIFPALFLTNEFFKKTKQT